MIHYLSREVTQTINEVGEVIEWEIIQYDDHYSVTATICQEQPPFKDYLGSGRGRYNKSKAMKQALEDLYVQAYPH